MISTSSPSAENKGEEIVIKAYSHWRKGYLYCRYSSLCKSLSRYQTSVYYSGSRGARPDCCICVCVVQISLFLHVKQSVALLHVLDDRPW